MCGASSAEDRDSGCGGRHAQERHLGLAPTTLVFLTHDTVFPSQTRGWQDLEGTLLLALPPWKQGVLEGGLWGPRAGTVPLHHQLVPKALSRPPFSLAQALEGT